MKIARLAIRERLVQTVRTVPCRHIHHMRPINRHEIRMTEHPVSPKPFLAQQPFDQCRLQGLKVMRFQYPQHILNRVHMRQTGVKEPFIILPKRRFVTFIIHRIAGALLEQKHRDSH